MSRSPCCAPSLKNLLPPSIVHPKDFNKSPSRLSSSPNLLLQPPSQNHLLYKSNSLSPFAQCNTNLQSHQPLSPARCFNFSSPKKSFTSQPSSPCVDSPQRLLFVSKIKTTFASSSNLLGRGRFGKVVLAKYKGRCFILFQSASVTICSFRGLCGGQDY